jgi:hypothetical protein
MGLLPQGRRHCGRGTCLDVCGLFDFKELHGETSVVGCGRFPRPRSEETARLRPEEKRGRPGVSPVTVTWPGWRPGPHLRAGTPLAARRRSGTEERETGGIKRPPGRRAPRTRPKYPGLLSLLAHVLAGMPVYAHGDLGVLPQAAVKLKSVGRKAINRHVFVFKDHEAK